MNDTLLKKRLSFVLNICQMFNQLDSPNLILLKKVGKKLIRNKVVTVSRVERDQVHLYVLHNEIEVEPYVEMHKGVLRGLNRIEMKIGLYESIIEVSYHGLRNIFIQSIIQIPL